MQYSTILHYALSSTVCRRRSPPTPPTPSSDCSRSAPGPHTSWPGNQSGASDGFSRAERAVYQEAKRLVALRWARAKKTSTGRRTSTVYRITPAGQQALRNWLAEPSEPTQIESEAALKVFFADQAGITELRATITGIRDDAADALQRLGAMAAGEYEFAERNATNVLSMRLITDLHETLYRWAEWADTAVDVLEKADQRAVQRQTQDALQAIVTTGAALP
jgi:DNA-binding PadR family transcriptional regulator